MNKNQKKGFTLVELLAVIAILGLVLIIAVPKVIDTIDNSKRRTLELTAQSIIKSAEEKYLENDTFGINEDITCERVSNISKKDYESCKIKFNEVGDATVTIIGSGRYEDISVCNGTKEDTTAIDGDSCPVEAATYITELLANESTLNNGLIVDDTDDENIRYVGADPANYVYFNCEDTHDGKSYGSDEYDYDSACEIWRIIGVFDIKETDSESEQSVKRVKIVRNENLISASYDSSSNNNSIENNKGEGINQWGKSKYNNGTSYEGADLMRMLNGYYIGKEDTCACCTGTNQGECSTINNCKSKITPLTTSSLNMIDNALWNLGAPTFTKSITISTMYEGERSNQTGKICSSGEYCNDEVIRTTIWVGKIGLIYPTDYAYASTNEDCASNIYGSNSKCNLNNWLDSGISYFTITPLASPTFANFGWSIDQWKRVIDTRTYSSVGVRPTLYLSSNVKIIGGNGDTEPYILSL